MTNDLYQSFAYDYNRFDTSDQISGNEYDFFERLFALYHVESVLDCACGTGHHLFAFHQMDKKVAGSDLSLSMLDVARRYLSGKDLEIGLKQCDFRSLEQAFDERFHTVVCLSTSLPHLHTDEDLIRALTSMRNRLLPKGILVLTQGTTDRNLLEVPPIEVVVNQPDFTRVFVKEATEDFLDIHILDIFHTFARQEHRQYDMRYRLLLEDDYRRLLLAAGFSRVSFLGDYEMTPYSKTESTRMIVVAER